MTLALNKFPQPWFILCVNKREWKRGIAANKAHFLQLMLPLKQNCRQKVVSRGALRSCREGLTFKFTTIPPTYSVSDFNLGGFGALFGGTKPTKSPSWRRDARNFTVPPDHLRSEISYRALATFQNIGKTIKQGTLFQLNTYIVRILIKFDTYTRFFLRRMLGTRLEPVVTRFLWSKRPNFLWF